MPCNFVRFSTYKLGLVLPIFDLSDMLHFSGLLPQCKPPLLRILPLLPQSHQGIETLAKVEKTVRRSAIISYISGAAAGYNLAFLMFPASKI